MQLLPFVSGFMLALILVVPPFVLLYCRATRTRATDDNHRRWLEELGKLTGSLRGNVS